MDNALTFDVEDWFEGLDPEPAHWEQYEPRVEESTAKIIELLERHKTRATFFFLGYIAARFPDLVRMVQDAGHEIAAHGYYHRFIFKQTRDEFKNEVIETKEVLENITGQPVTGFRAPYFSIVKSTLWALDVLAELGFSYDSSIFPVFNHRYGIPEARRDPHRPDLKTAQSLVEFPISTIRLLGQNWPFSGGIYFRFLRPGFIARGIRSLNKKGWPVVMYLHPWEFDPLQPMHPRIPTALRLRHYYNLDKTEAKLDRILDEFHFKPLADLAARVS